MVAGPVRRSLAVRMDRISLAVVLLVTAALVVLIPRPNADVTMADYSTELAAARASAPYDVATPTGLREGWRTSSVGFFTHDGATRWHLGFVTPSGGQVGIDQIDVSRHSFVALATGGGTRDGHVVIDGLVWGKRLFADRDLRSLVLHRTDSVIVLSGTAGYGELVELADALA